MSTSYPTGLDSLTNPTASDDLDTVGVVHHEQHTNANDAIEAIQAELGTEPSGASATVKARLDTLDTTVSGKAASGHTHAGGSLNTGTATLDFGAFPGKADTTVAVTGQTSIIAGSVVQAWLRPVATADHSADEHLVEELRVSAGAIAAGTGFTIYGTATDQRRIYGQWTVAWLWA